MPVEIERKFLTSGFVPTVSPHRITQGYLSLNWERTVRVRTIEFGVGAGADWVCVFRSVAYITVKVPTDDPKVRGEYEYEIPFKDAEELLKACGGSLVIKDRYKEGRWDVDVFTGENEGLIVAEIELTSPDEVVELPPWVDVEVTAEESYTNARLATIPFKDW